jgi:ceramide glucosyltransferase
VASIVDTVFWLLAAAATLGTLYQIVSATLLGRLFSAGLPEAKALPPVSVLKPLCGLEPDLERNLRSFCQQNYPAYQIVFGVHDADDEALAVAKKLQGEFPDLAISLSIGSGRPESGNPKVANLLDMMPHASHDVLVLSDSDTLAEAGCLKALVSALQQPGVGISTCLYVGHPAASLWSRLGAMGINHGFLPSIAVAKALGRKDGCFGAAIALRRGTLEQIGGLDIVRDHLADDYYLGAAVRRQGLEIGLAATYPSCTVHETGFSSLFQHELRWGRTLASIERLGFVASLITLGIPFALIMLFINPGLASLSAAALSLGGRLWAVRSEERLLNLDRQPIWMIPVRDVLTVFITLAALSGRTINWRDQPMRLSREGTLHPLEKSAKP